MPQRHDSSPLLPWLLFQPRYVMKDGKNLVSGQSIGIEDIALGIKESWNDRPTWCYQVAKKLSSVLKMNDSHAIWWALI